MFKTLLCLIFSYRICVFGGIVRLSNGSYTHEGRVEVYSNGKWHNVCGHKWSFETADIICRELGYSFAIHPSTSANFGKGSFSMMSIPIVCEGTEKTLEECEFKHDQFCPHSSDVGVVCSTNELEKGSVRLDGTIGYKWYACGEVQVYLDSRWGGICDKRSTWNEVAADVACKQMGFDGGSIKTGSTYTHKAKQVIGSIYCTGSESKLLDCQYDRDTSGCSRRKSSPSKVGVMACCYYKIFTAWFCIKLLTFLFLLVGIPSWVCIKIGWYKATIEYLTNAPPVYNHQTRVVSRLPATRTVTYEEVQYTTVTRKRFTTDHISVIHAAVIYVLKLY